MEEYKSQYTAIVRSVNGNARGYVIKAKDRQAALQRLLEYLGEGNKYVTDITLAEVLLDNDLAIE